MTKVKVKSAVGVRVKVEPEVKITPSVPLYLRPHNLHEHEDSSDLAVSLEDQLIKKQGSKWIAFTPEYYEDKNRTPGSVLFAGADGKISENENFIWDYTLYQLKLKNRIVIGNFDPDDFVGSATGRGSLFIGGSLYIDSNSNGWEPYLLNHIGVNVQPVHRVFRANGSVTSPTKVLAGQSLYTLQIRAFDSVGAGSNGFRGTNSAIELVLTQDVNSESFQYLTRIRSGAGSAINVFPQGVIIGGVIPFSTIPLGRFVVFGQNSNNLTYTAQFHNSSGNSNTLVLRDDIRVGVAQLNPQETLHISGNIRIGLSANNGYYIDWGQDAVGSSGSFARIQGIRTDANGNQAGDLVFYTKERTTGGVTPSERWRLFENGKSRFQLIHTATVSNDFAWRFTGTLTAPTIAGLTTSFLIDPTMVARDNSQTLSSLDVSTTFNLGVFTNTIKQLYRFRSLPSGRFVTLIDNDASAALQYIHNADIVYNNNGSATNIFFNNSAVSTRTALLSNGDLVVGTNSSSGARAHIRGNGSLSGNALLVENSSPSPILTALNIGSVLYGNGTSSTAQEAVFGSVTNPWTIKIGSIASSLFVYQTGSNPSVRNQANQDGYFIGSLSTTNSAYSKLWLGFLPSFGFNSVSGSSHAVTISADFIPTSGTAEMNLLRLIGVVNQTGGANGITRGLLISLTTTSAVDYRAIEVTHGRSLFRNIEVQSGDTISFGNPNTDGTWRFVRNNNDLIIQRRESGVYNTKQTILA